MSCFVFSPQGDRLLSCSRVAALRFGSTCFSVRMSDALEKELAKSSVGLVKAEDYKRKREQLQINEVLGKARADGLAQAPEEVKKKKKKKEKPSGLSFDDELDGEAEVSPKMGAKKMGKCQDVGECCSCRHTPHACRVGCATDTAARSVRARRRFLPQDELARRPGLRTGEGAGEPTAPAGRKAWPVRVSRPWAALTTLPAASPPCAGDARVSDTTERRQGRGSHRELHLSLRGQRAITHPHPHHPHPNLTLTLILTLTLTRSRSARSPTACTKVQ